MNQIEFYEAKLKYETDSWDLFEALNARQGVVVIDVRSVEAFESEHIPYAINIPHRTMSEETTGHLNKSSVLRGVCFALLRFGSTKQISSRR